jgi:16S rRNA (uracil1498-N3)-methyltransferase
VTPAPADALRHAAAHAVVDDIDLPVPDDATEHHLFRVLRLRDGEAVTVTDGAGAWRGCVVRADRLEPVTAPSTIERRPDPVTIAFAIPKQDRPEWIVQKLTELGVDRIVLLHADRSVVRWAPDRAAKHLGKLRRVAVQAVEQSRGVWLPEITGPVPSAEVLPTAVAAEPGGRPLEPTDRLIAIGPEGGWSPDEIAVAADRVALGSTILRVETAAIVAAARVVAHVR